MITAFGLQLNLASIDSQVYLVFAGYLLNVLVRPSMDTYKTYESDNSMFLYDRNEYCPLDDSIIAISLITAEQLFMTSGKSPSR